MFKLGLGIPYIYTLALHCFTPAAIQADATKQYNLGVMYKNGLGVDQT